jgi:hypothetical protein
MRALNSKVLPSSSDVAHGFLEARTFRREQFTTSAKIVARRAPRGRRSGCAADACWHVQRTMRLLCQ